MNGHGVRLRYLVNRHVADVEHQVALLSAAAQGYKAVDIGGICYRFGEFQVTRAWPTVHVAFAAQLDADEWPVVAAVYGSDRTREYVTRLDASGMAVESDYAGWCSYLVIQ